MIGLSKCFDTIPHDRLLTKLEQYCIDTRWFASYLCDHYQQVLVRLPDGRSSLSRPLLNPFGTYQGSALGTLLFNIYSTDMPLCLTDAAPQDRCLVQYADDTQLAVLGSPRDTASMVVHLRQDLVALSVWSSKNDLKVNAEKTQLILIGTKKRTS